MSIIRVRRQANFTTIPNELINDSRLEWQELGLLVYLLSKPENWDIRIPALAEERDLKERTLYGIFKKFKGLGYATFQKNRNGTSEWTITDSPQAVDQVITPDGKNCSLQNLQPANSAGSKKPRGKNCHVIQKKDLLQKTEEEDKKQITTQSVCADGLPGCIPRDVWEEYKREVELNTGKTMSITRILACWKELAAMDAEGYDVRKILERCVAHSFWTFDRKPETKKAPAATNQKPGLSSTQRGNHDRPTQIQQSRGTRANNIAMFAERAAQYFAGDGPVPAHGNQLSGEMDAIDAEWTELSRSNCGMG